MIIRGKTGYLKSDFIHEDHKDITKWVNKHNKYATLEALELAEQYVNVEALRSEAQQAVVQPVEVAIGVVVLKRDQVGKFNLTAAFSDFPFD